MSILDRKKQLARIKKIEARLATKTAQETERSPTASTEQASAVLDAFRARAKAEAKRYKDATDTEYWIAVCFHNREDKDAFLAEHAPGLGDKYLDGYAVAAALKRRGG